MFEKGSGSACLLMNLLLAAPVNSALGQCESAVNHCVVRFVRVHAACLLMLRCCMQLRLNREKSVEHLKERVCVRT